MKIQQIRYFIALAEELNFHRAAERLSISQPPLSHAIRQLEEHIGTALFKRTTKSVALTAAGVALYPEALRLLALLDQACKTTLAVGQGLKGHMTIGFVGGMLFRGVPEAIHAFNQESEHAQISLREMSSADQLHALQHEQLSAGFLHAGKLTSELQSITISEEPFVVCLPKNHRLAIVEVIDLSALAQEDMIIFARDASPTYYDSVISLCAAANFSPTIRHNVRHWLTAVLMVSKGLGVALVPQGFMQTSLAGVSFVQIKNIAGVSRSQLVWKAENDDPTLVSFIQYFLDRMSAGQQSVRA